MKKKVHLRYFYQEFKNFQFSLVELLISLNAIEKIKDVLM